MPGTWRVQLKLYLLDYKMINGWLNGIKQVSTLFTEKKTKNRLSTWSCLEYEHKTSHGL